MELILQPSLHSLQEDCVLEDGHTIYTGTVKPLFLASSTMDHHDVLSVNSARFHLALQFKLSDHPPAVISEQAIRMGGLGSGSYDDRPHIEGSAVAIAAYGDVVVAG